MTPVNTFDPASLLPNLRAFLVEAGVARVPRDAGSLPPCWLDPKRNIPYPGQTEGLGPNEGTVVDTKHGIGGLVIAIYPETGIPSIPHEGFYVRSAVAIWYRSQLSPEIQAAHRTMRGLIHDVRNYSLNGLQVNQSLIFRELQRIGSDGEGYTYNSEYMFELWGDDNAPLNP
jgi:hypothetical protein